MILSPLLPEPFQSLAAPLLQPLGDRAVALGPSALDLSSPLLIDPLLLSPSPLEPLRHGLAAAPERDYLAVTPAETTRRHAVRSLIGDAIVPREPHAAGDLAASEAL